MQLKRVRFKSFRSLKDSEIELGDTTVLIGPNNSGKSAILEGIRIALTRRWGQRGTGFTEYDIHLHEGRLDPKTGDPVQIEVELQEETPGDWPDELQAALDDIIQPDPLTGAASILLRVSCAWDVVEESYVPRWEFLNVNRNPLTGKGARLTNMQEFFQYLQVFYLEALRDSDSEFSSKSQFWGRLLRTVQLPSTLEKRAKRTLDLLNRKILDASPLLGHIADGVSSISRVAAADTPGSADVRMLPLQSWDLLSRAEIIYRSEHAKPWLPLSRHGQGIQSLSVIFLFKSFVQHLLTQLFRPETSAVLALEEPETHLHPQAARTLWRHVEALPGQKIVTTHSPFFLQNIPFRDIRVIRSGDNGTYIRSLPREFRSRLPHSTSVDSIVANSGGLLKFIRGRDELVVFGALPQNLYRDLLASYAQTPDARHIQGDLKLLYEKSREFISDEELEQLETFARRIRGEIFFARRWLLVEGQSDYHILHGVAAGLGYDLDEHGVSVIDFQNCGNPSCFAALARALEYPWLMLVDGDSAGTSYIATVRSRGFDQQEIDRRCVSLPSGTMEEQLIATGLQQELVGLLVQIGVKLAPNVTDPELLLALENNKTAYAALLGKRCRADSVFCARMPGIVKNVVSDLKGLI